MNEEFVTKKIIKFLKSKNWNIFSFDYPQSGTGFLLHPNDRLNKNKEAIIPDIIANKNDTCIIMENKSYLYLEDFYKLNNLKNNNNYSDDFSRLSNQLNCKNIKYGIGIPLKFKNKAEKYLDLIDFIVLVNENGECFKIL